jgi:hypothetical protein
MVTKALGIGKEGAGVEAGLDILSSPDGRFYIY